MAQNNNVLIFLENPLILELIDKNTRFKLQKLAKIFEHDFYFSGLLKIIGLGGIIVVLYNFFSLAFKINFGYFIETIVILLLVFSIIGTFFYHSIKNNYIKKFIRDSSKHGLLDVHPITNNDRVLNNNICEFLIEAINYKIIDKNTAIILQDYANKHVKNPTSFLTFDKKIKIFSVVIFLSTQLYHFESYIYKLYHKFLDIWVAIPDIYKLKGYISLIICLYILSYFIANRFLIIFKTIHFFIALMMLVGINIIDQIFLMNIKHGEFYLIFFALTLPMGVFLSNRWISFISIIGFYFWVFDFSKTNINYNFYLFYFIILILSFAVYLSNKFKNFKNYFNLAKNLGYFSIFLMIFIFDTYDFRFLVLAILIFSLIQKIFNFKNILNYQTSFYKLFLQPEFVLLAILIASNYYYDFMYSIIGLWSSVALTYRGVHKQDINLFSCGVCLCCIILLLLYDYFLSFFVLKYLILGLLMIILGITFDIFRSKLANKIISKNLT